MNASRGIIIKSFFPAKGRIIVFDEEQGRRDVFLHSRSLPRTLSLLSAGMLVRYHLTEWHNQWILVDIEPIAYPAGELCTTLLFIHHLIELLLFFTAEGQPSPELFNFIAQVYSIEQGSWLKTRFTQQLFLCKFFSLLGVYPDERAYRQAAGVRRLLLLPLDTMVKTADEHDMAPAVQAWLLACVHTHPQVRLLKTLLCYSE